MPERFNLDATLALLGKGMYALIGHICFDAGLYGFIVVAGVAIAGYVLRSSRYGHPLLVVARKLGIVCVILVLPGVFILTSSHCLPPIGVLNISPLAFVIFWSWICLHLSAEEMNFSL
jgi:hypothetical protein